MYDVKDIALWMLGNVHVFVLSFFRSTSASRSRYSSLAVSRSACNFGAKFCIISTLLSLQDEALQQIVLRLPYHTLFALRRTCHRLNGLVTDSIVRSAHSRLKAELLVVEFKLYGTLSGEASNHSFDWYSSEVRRNARRRLQDPVRLTCYTCLFELPLSKFAQYQTVED